MNSYVRWYKRFHIHPIMGAIMLMRGSWNLGFEFSRDRSGYRFCTTTEIGPFILDFDLEGE